MPFPIFFGCFQTKKCFLESDELWSNKCHTMVLLFGNFEIICSEKFLIAEFYLDGRAISTPWFSEISPHSFEEKRHVVLEKVTNS